MEHIRTASAPGYQQLKRRFLIAAAAFSALLAPFWVFFDEGGLLSRLIDFVSVIGFGILILGWCYYDSLERGKPLGAGFRILIVLFGLLALFIYLLKSRGLGRGLRSIGAALLVCIGMVLVMFVSAAAFALVSGIE